MNASVPVADKSRVVAETAVEVSRTRTWTTVPALRVGDAAILVDGKALRMARVHDEEWLEHELNDPQLCVQALKATLSRDLRADVFTFAQRPPATTPQYGYPMEWDSIAAIRLTNFKEWWGKLPQATRKNVRRAEKRGVEVRIREYNDDLVRDIIELSNDSPVRQGKPFAHYGKTFEQVKKDQATHLERSDFICAYAENELIGLLKVVYSGELASILLFLPKASQQEKRPANALMAKLVEISEAKGISHIVYGKFSYGNKRNSSLLEFKVRNGFEEILVPRYYIPLSKWGEVCLKLKLHRGVMGILPARLIGLAVRVRERWYTVRNFRAGVAQ